MTYCSVATVVGVVGLTEKLFGHYPILKVLSLRSPSKQCPYQIVVCSMGFVGVLSQ